MNFLRFASHAAVLVVMASTGAAQTNSTATSSNPHVLVLDHEFTASNEFVRVFLQGGEVYRAELNSPDVLLQVRGVQRNIQYPDVYPFLAASTPSGTSILEVYPKSDAEYEIHSVARSVAGVSTRLRLYRDVAASARRQHVRTNRAWEVGLELAGGWHSGFAQSSAVPLVGVESEGGTDIEGCFTARATSAASRFGICALGIGYQNQPGARSILWIHTEPRIRILGGAAGGRSGWELGALFRAGLGMISASPDTPVILAPGAYIAHHMRRSSRRGGLTFHAAYARAVYKGFSRPEGAEQVTPKGHRVSLGIGWYR